MIAAGIPNCCANKWIHTGQPATVAKQGVELDRAIAANLKAIGFALPDAGGRSLTHTWL
jgi:hypothetical protein